MSIVSAIFCLFMAWLNWYSWSKFHIDAPYIVANVFIAAAAICCAIGFKK